MEKIVDYNKNQCQSYRKDEKTLELVRCENIGTRRIDNGLESGVHCDDCWEEMIMECRQRSY